jgi:hypothetical protein
VASRLTDEIERARAGGGFSRSLEALRAARLQRLLAWPD